MATNSEQATLTQAPTIHISALDGVRGLAILLVLIHHFSGIPMFGLGEATGSYKEWSRFASLGRVGVDLFFVLSGFLITSILYDAKGPARDFFKNFYARRALRIFPVYFATLLVLLFVLPLLIPGEKSFSADLRDSQLWLWLYLVNIQSYVTSGSLGSGNFLAGHLWSLAVEEQFYLVWPMFVFLFGRRSLIAITAILIVTAVVVRFAMIARGDPGVEAVMLTPARMDTLAVGAGIALLVRSQWGRSFLRTVAWPVAAAGFTGLVALFIQQDGSLVAADPTVVRVGPTLLAALFGGLIATLVLAPPTSTLSRIFSWQPLRVLGKYSYALYVVHYPVIFILVRQTTFYREVSTWAGFQLAGVFAVAFVASMITFVLALLSWKLLEMPFLSLKSRFSSKPVRMSWSG